MGQVCSDRGTENSTSITDNETYVLNVSTTRKCQENITFDLGRIFETPEFFTAQWLMLNYMRVVFPIGFLANMATLFVLGHMRPWKVWKVYVAVLAVSDTLVLFFKFLTFESGIIENGGPNEFLHCDVVLYIGVTLTEFSHWVLVFMTLQRFAIIWFPIRMSGKKLNRVYGMLFGLGLTLLTINTAYFWIKGDAWNSVTFYSCAPPLQFETVVERFWKWIRSAIYGIVPCFLIVTANFGVITGWMLSYRRHRKLTGAKDPTGPSAKNVAKHLQITTMIMSVSVCFALVVVPHTIYMIAANTTQNADNIGHAFLEKAVIIMFTDLNYCSNFFLYSLSSSDFRRKFTQLICFQHTSKEAIKS